MFISVLLQVRLQIVIKTNWFEKNEINRSINASGWLIFVKNYYENYFLFYEVLHFELPVVSLIKILKFSGIAPFQ